MHRTKETEQLNSSKDDEPEVARRRRVLLSLSWYSSVPFGRAHAVTRSLPSSMEGCIIPDSGGKRNGTSHKTI